MDRAFILQPRLGFEAGAQGIPAPVGRWYSKLSHAQGQACGSEAHVFPGYIGFLTVRCPGDLTPWPSPGVTRESAPITHVETLVRHNFCTHTGTLVLMGKTLCPFLSRHERVERNKIHVDNR